MADFLAKLAARSLGQLPSVQPRIASHFEHDAAWSQERPLDQLDLEVESARPVTRSTPPGADRDTGSEDDESSSLPERSHIAAELKATQAVTTVIEHVRQASEPDGVAEPPAEAAQAPQAQTRAPAPPPLDPSQSVIELQEEATSSSDPERKHMPPPPPSAESGPRAIAAVRVDEVMETARKRVGIQEDTVPSDRTSQAAATPSGPLRVATRVAAHDGVGDAPTNNEPAQPAPQVTVSIGRIEVRAAPRPEPVRPVQPAARPQPTLSLGEYLERSRKGRR